MFGSGKLARFANEVFVRKLVFAGTSVILILLCSLLCFYFQIGLQKGLGNIIAYLGFGIIVAITILAFRAKKKDDYCFMLLATYGASNDLSGFKNMRDAVTYVESFTNDIVGGYAGYKQALGENKEILNCMLTNLEAFPEYAGKGPISALAKLLLKFSLGTFKVFAIMDMILSGETSNSYYRLLSATRWYPQYKRYSKNPFMWLLVTLAPWIAWLIISNIITSAVSTGVDLAGGGLFLIKWGLFCICLQLTHFMGNRAVVERISADIVGTDTNPPIIEPSSFKYCKGFCQLSPLYCKLAMDAGIMTQESLQEDEQSTEVTEQTQDDQFDEFADFE